MTYLGLEYEKYIGDIVDDFTIRLYIRVPLLVTAPALYLVPTYLVPIPFRYGMKWVLSFPSVVSFRDHMSDFLSEEQGMI